MAATRSILSDKGYDTLTGYDFTQQPALTRANAIRAKCVECCAGSAIEPKRCQLTDCALWPYRTGRENVTLYGGDE